MPTRDIANKRIALAIGASSAITDFDAPTATELNGMLNIQAAVRWDGYDFGTQASDRIDDRSLDDDAAAQIASFEQFGGGIPIFLPKVTDLSSIQRQAFNLLKVQRSIVSVATRVGFKSGRAAFAIGDNVSTFLAMVDGYTPDAEGQGGYAGIFPLLPQGTTFPWTKVAGGTLAAIGSTTLTPEADDMLLLGVTDSFDVMTARATWTSDDPTVAVVHGPGIVEIVGASTDTATITASFPGFTDETWDITVAA